MASTFSRRSALVINNTRAAIIVMFMCAGITFLFAVPGDIDDDGVGDGSDNCVNTYNPGQADTDGDTVGDVCDNCPTLSNPAQSVLTKLSDNLVPGGNVTRRLLSPDGAWVVYMADQDSDEVFEFFSVPSSGGTPVKLSGPLVPGGDVRDRGLVGISPDSTTFVFMADKETDEVIELYSVPIGGGTPVKLNSALPAGGDVDSFLYSGDGTRVLYIADQDTDEVFELYSVALAGGSPVKLNASLVAGGDVKDFHPSPDGARVVYMADQDSDETVEIYSVATAGGTAVKLNDTAIPGEAPGVLRISPDSSRAAYIYPQSALGELYSVPLTGGAVTKLNAQLIPSQGRVASFEISPDSSRVVYSANQETTNSFEFYSVPLAGGSVTKLNGQLMSNAWLSGRRHLVSPDGTKVVYLAPQDTASVNEIYVVPIGGGASTKLNGQMTTGGSVQAFDFTPDSGTVVYLAQQDQVQPELYSVSSAGGATTKLNGPLVAGGSIASFFATPDSSRVVYMADQDIDEVREMYSVPAAGGAVTKLNADFTTGQAIHALKAITPDSSRLIYRANQDDVNTIELYSVPLTGGIDTDTDGILDACDVCPTDYDPGQANADGDPAGAACECDDNDGSVYPGAPQICDGVNNDCMDPGWPAVPSTESDPDGDLVLACAPDNCPSVPNPGQVDLDGDGDGDACDHCPSVANAGQEMAVKISGDMETGFTALELLLSPDGNTVVFGTARPVAPGGAEVFSVPVGGGPVVKLSDPLPAGWEAFFPEISPDSTTVVFTQQVDPNASYAIFSVPLGGGPTVQLSAADAPSGASPVAHFASGGSRVVYNLESAPFDAQLFSVPVQGGTSLSLSAGMTVGSFTMSPDGDTVVFLADDPNSPGSNEVVYSVPAAGGTPERLSDVPVAGGYVHDYRITADSSRVVYLVDQDTPGVLELYSAPLGGGTPVKLNPALVAGGSVYSGGFYLSPDSLFVVYQADQDTDNVLELYSVPVAGGTVRKLNGTLAGSFVLSADISPDSSTVAYIARQDSATAYEAYSVSILGGATTKLSSPLVPGGNVSWLDISPDGSYVVYRADQDLDNQRNLYRVPLTGGTPLRLTGPMAAGQNVVHASFTADSTTLVYVADQDTDDVYELYSVPATGGASWKLNDDLIPGGDVPQNDSGYQIVPGDARLIYAADQETDEIFEIYSVPLVTDFDGDASPDSCDLCPDVADPGQADADGDLSGTACDCNDGDSTIYPGGIEICDGANNDCDDPAWPALPPDEADDDLDTFSECDGDCDDGDGSTYPQAPEVNDALDNQCTGDPGFGVVDEVSGDSGFVGTGNDTYCWPDQGGATSYQVVRSTAADFSVGCTSFVIGGTCLTDPDVPPANELFYYRVRALTPVTGSWGQESSGLEIALTCGTEQVCDDGLDLDGDLLTDCNDPDCAGDPSCASTFSFVSTFGDDVAADALYSFFSGIPAGTGDYILFEMAETAGVKAWCAERADWYRDNYLAYSQAGLLLVSGSWNKWHRSPTTGGAWTGPVTTGYQNVFECGGGGAYSWCSEQDLGGLRLNVNPEWTSQCELVDGYVGCSDGTWQLTITIAGSRQTACGF